MTGCAQPWQRLTTPAELLERHLPNDVLSIEIRMAEGHIVLHTLLATIGYLENAYAALSRIFVAHSGSEPKLQILSIQSGSPTIRIDCKGLADVVQALKQLLIELWHKARHKRAEEQIERNSALLSTLGVINQIEEQRRKGSLVAEDAENIKRILIDSALGLLECNAVPTQIHEREIVNNNKLLADFSPKFLTDGTQQDSEPIADKPLNPEGDGPSNAGTNKTSQSGAVKMKSEPKKKKRNSKKVSRKEHDSDAPSATQSVDSLIDDLEL